MKINKEHQYKQIAISVRIVHGKAQVTLRGI